MAEVPRERFVPDELRRRAYRDGALRIDEGQTISQPWIVACMAQLLELERPRAGARGGHRLGLRGGGALAALPRGGDDRALRSLAGEARARWPSSATTTSRCARGRRAGRARTGRRSTASRSPPPPPASRPRRCSTQLAPGGALVCPVERGGRELLMRFRDGERGGARVGAVRAPGGGRDVRPGRGANASLPRSCSSSTSIRRCSSTSSSGAARRPRSGSVTRQEVPQG